MTEQLLDDQTSDPSEANEAASEASIEAGPVPVSNEVRIIYHPAPFPGPDGMPRKPEPINLGGDLERALGWMRRRLSLYDAEPLVRFVNEIIDVDAPPPMSEPELAEASERAAAAVEAYDAERADRALSELATELDQPEMYDEDGSAAADEDFEDPLAGLEDIGDDERR